MTSPVPYAVARDILRTGDLLGTDAPGLIEGGIRGVTQGALSHVASPIELLIAGQRRLFVIEATHASGVHLVAASLWIADRCQRGEVYWWPCNWTQERRDSYALEVTQHLGAPYESEMDMLWFVARGKAPPANSRWYCSELDAAGRRVAEPERFLALWPVNRAVWPKHSAAAYGGLERSLQVSA